MNTALCVLLKKGEEDLRKQQRDCIEIINQLLPPTWKNAHL